MVKVKSVGLKRTREGNRRAEVAGLGECQPYSPEAERYAESICLRT